MILISISLVKLLYHFQNNMGGTWSDAKRRCELMSRQKKQMAILREIGLRGIRAPHTCPAVNSRQGFAKILRHIKYEI